MFVSYHHFGDAQYWFYPGKESSGTAVIHWEGLQMHIVLKLPLKFKLPFHLDFSTLQNI